MSALDHIAIIARKEIREILTNKGLAFSGIFFATWFSIMAGLGITEQNITQHTQLNNSLFYMGALIGLFVGYIYSGQTYLREKQTGIVETLLCSPVSLRSIWIGKALGVALPSTALALLSAAAITLIADQRASGIAEHTAVVRVAVERVVRNEAGWLTWRRRIRAIDRHVSTERTVLKKLPAFTRSAEAGIQPALDRDFERVAATAFEEERVKCYSRRLGNGERADRLAVTGRCAKVDRIGGRLVASALSTNAIERDAVQSQVPAIVGSGRDRIVARLESERRPCSDAEVIASQPRAARDGVVVVVRTEVPSAAGVVNDRGGARVKVLDVVDLRPEIECTCPCTTIDRIPDPDGLDRVVQVVVVRSPATDDVVGLDGEYGCRVRRGDQPAREENADGHQR